MRELGHHVAPTIAHEGLEQPRREGLEVRAHGIDARSREQRVHERPVDAVLRRIELEREQRVGARLRGWDEGRARDRGGERFTVERRGNHVVIAGQQPEAAIEIGVKQRMRVADRPEDALRILDELRVVLVEAHAPPGRIWRSRTAGVARRRGSTFIGRTSFGCRHRTAGPVPAPVTTGLKVLRRWIVMSS